MGVEARGALQPNVENPLLLLPFRVQHRLCDCIGLFFVDGRQQAQAAH